MLKAESGESKRSGEVTESRIEVRVRHRREYWMVPGAARRKRECRWLAQV